MNFPWTCLRNIFKFRTIKLQYILHQMKKKISDNIHPYFAYVSILWHHYLVFVKISKLKSYALYFFDYIFVIFNRKQNSIEYVEQTFIFKFKMLMSAFFLNFFPKNRGVQPIRRQESTPPPPPPATCDLRVGLNDLKPAGPSENMAKLLAIPGPTLPGWPWGGPPHAPPPHHIFAK